MSNNKKVLEKLSYSPVFWGYLFITPLVLGLAIFYFLPIIGSLYLAFVKWDGLTAPKFIGFKNFIDLFQDPIFSKAIWNTAIFVMGTVPLTIGFSILIAIALNQKIKGIGLYRTLFFLPVVTMPVAVAMVWKWLYSHDYGIINYVLELLHLPKVAWLSDPKIVLFSLIIVQVWSKVGYDMVVILSGLQGIPKTYYEAAEIDGANGFYRFWYITLPLLTPSIFFLTIIGMIQSFQVFDLVYMMGVGEGFIGNATRTIVYSIYEIGFVKFNMGYATAQAWILFFIIFGLTMVQMYLQKKWVHYS